MRSFDDVEKLSADLWAEYRKARDENASAETFEALQKRVRGLRARAKKAGLLAITQQLGDLGEYIKRYRPRTVAARASAEELERETAALRAAFKALGAAPASNALRALLAGALKMEKSIENAREQDPDADSDHDEYVTVEEQLWDLKSDLARALAGRD